VIVEDTIIIIDPNLEAFPDYSFLIRVIVMPVLLIYAQLYRRRQMGGIQRQQTKFALAGFILGNLGYIIEQLTLENRTLFLLPEPTLYLTMRPLAFLLFMCAATCFTYAVLRYHLWDIDFVINRSLVYSALTVLLGSVFAAGFFALRAFMQAVFQARQDLIAVAIPAVVITALFTPTRKALRRFVDQRIYGIQLDYEEVADDRAVKHLQSPLDPKISFGIYKDMELVGRGGMSEVYCAYHPILKRRVAIKILSKNLLLDEIARKRFDHEAQAISMLSHPNIVTCYEYNEHDGVPYMVLEFLEGQALSQIIRKSGRLPLNEALPILRDVASALDFAHAHGIIHRDVKPSNVIVEQKQAAAGGQNQRAVLTDFGIAKLYNVTHLTSTGNMLGSLDYVSPEQIRGAGEADLRSDIYSFGVMAYEMLTGTLPFGHGNPGALVMAHLLTPPPDPRTKIPDLPAPAAEALLRAMAKDPQSRQKTVQDLVMALEQCEQIQHTASMQATEVLGDVVRNHL
jgi:tRNA A-37 threonylcarbamoyl transferase component Bud32